MWRRQLLGASASVLSIPVAPPTRGRRIRSRSAPGADVERIISDTYDEPGLATALGESGETVLFGFDDGSVLVYRDDRDGEVLPHSGNQPVSHVEVRESAAVAVVGWMDAGTFSLLDLVEHDGPTVEHGGLWALDATPDADRTVSVSYPIEDPGSLLAVDEVGGRSWETRFDDAVGLSVAISDDGTHVAVGAGNYWENGVDPAGQPGVRFYDEDGEELWRHAHHVAVHSIAVDGDRELVVAGTDDGRTIVFDFEGVVRRETDEYGGWIVLSDDGSTVLTGESDGLVAVDSETGDERWTADVGMWVAGDIAVAADGSRAFATDRNETEFVLVEEGERIWSASHDVGPGHGSLAADGETWSTIVTDLDDETARVNAFRATGTAGE